MTLTRRRFIAGLAAAPLAVKAFISDGASSLLLLKGKKVSTALYTNITTSEAIARVVDAAVWPTGQTTLDYWWLDNQDAFEAVQQLMEMEKANA